MGGKIYTPLGAWYHATKHALEGWSDCLRLELKQFGIDVVIIEPGIIETEFGEVLLDEVPDNKKQEESPYSTLQEAIVKATRETYEKGRTSPPEVIARLVSRAVRARRPKTRYAGGKFAKPMMWMRKYLGDRIFDRVVMSQV
jgi:short-subunit dehydrogenase